MKTALSGYTSLTDAYLWMMPFSFLYRGAGKQMGGAGVEVGMVGQDLIIGKLRCIDLLHHIGVVVHIRRAARRQKKQLMDTAWQNDQILFKPVRERGNQVRVQKDGCPVGAVLVGQDIDRKDLLIRELGGIRDHLGQDTVQVVEAVCQQLWRVGQCNLVKLLLVDIPEAQMIVIDQDACLVGIIRLQQAVKKNGKV